MGIFGRREKTPDEPHPAVRASVESGTTVADPSEDDLRSLLEDVQRGEEMFLIVERTSDGTGQTYVQTIPNGTGGYVVEHRDGDKDTHVATHFTDVGMVHALLTRWAAEMPDWDAGVDWSAELA